MWYFRAVHGHVARALGEPQPGRRVLDAGCGTGGLMRRLGGWEWTGVDVEPAACALARERTGAEIVEASLAALPWAEATFDAVTSVDVLYHIEDDVGALREMVRVLRPGGRVVINVPAYPWLWSYHDEAVHSVRRYGRREVADKLRAAGLAEVRTTHWNMIPLPLVVVRRKLWPAPRGGSDVAVQPPAVEAIFRGLMDLEAAWLRRGRTLPAGSSIFAVARKPAGREGVE